MSIIESIFLGLIQGLTEFLPVSSSGHLIIAREIFGLSLEGSLAFDVFLNTATLFAVIYCFAGDLLALIKDFLTQGFATRSKNLIYALILGTVPTAFSGFLYGDKIEASFRSGTSVALALIAGSLIMFIADRMKSKNGLTTLKGFGIGFFQALALIPGISRSGSTISGGLFFGLSREEALRFSFLLLIPVSLGALLKIFLDLDGARLAEFISFSHLAGFVAALFSGIWSVRFLMRYLSGHS